MFAKVFYNFATMQKCLQNYKSVQKCLQKKFFLWGGVKIILFSRIVENLFCGGKNNFI
jgi:hypothetical protein